MKRKLLICASMCIAFFSTMTSVTAKEDPVIPTNYRILDTTIWECYNTGGNCLPTIVVHP